MLENTYQLGLIKEIQRRYPGSVVLKNDTGYRQGIPDLTVLFEHRWAVLEVKPSQRAKKQPNQDYYVDLLNDMSYAAFIYPENEEVILNELGHALSPRRYPRFLKSK